MEKPMQRNNIITHRYKQPVPKKTRAEYERYFIYETGKCLIHVEDPWPEVCSVNSIMTAPVVVPGASALNVVWINSPKVDEVSYKPHWHDVGEYCMFIGSNPKDRYNLNGVLEWYFEDEKFATTRSCVIWIPEGVLHSPFVIPKVDPKYPILHIDVLMGACNVTDDPSHHVSNADPKWKAFKPYPEFLPDKPLAHKKSAPKSKK